MPRHPVADDGGELSDLEIDARIIQRRVAQKIFVERARPRLHRRIEAAIDAGLAEEIKMLRPLASRKIDNRGLKRITIGGEDEGGRGLIDEIGFEIEKAAQLQLKIIFESRIESASLA